MKLSDFNTEGKLGFITAGEALTRKDPVYLDGLSGKGYKCDTTDYAAVGTVTYGTPQTSEATGRIVAQTSVVGGQTIAYARQALVKNSSGHIFTLANNSGANGVTLTKFNFAGAVLGSVILESAATPFYNHHLLELPNGNLAAVYSSGSVLSYAVYDTNLVAVKAVTSITSISSDYFSACSLSAGGFAIVYHDAGGTCFLNKLVTYNNAGTAVLAATTIWTRTGTSGGQYHKIAQLSNGNLVYAIASNNTVSGMGLYHGITDISGVIVTAFAALHATASSWYPELSVMSGFYAIERHAVAGTTKVYVLNNAGVLQGAEFSEVTDGGASANNTAKLLNDGTAFYLIWHRSSDSKCMLSKLPTTGTGYTSAVITTSVTQYNFFLDAFLEHGHICAISMAGSGATAPTMWVVDVAAMALVNVAGTTFGTAPVTTNGTFPRVIAGGDGTFIAMYDYSSGAATNLCVGKYAQTAVLGVAATSAAADERVALNTLAGCYEINAIVGSASKAFDMTTNPLVGNKGTLVAKGACTLRGIGA